VEIAKIAERGGYLTEGEFKESLGTMSRSIQAFEAERECKDVGCFYNDTNWWLEKFIQSNQDVHDLEKIEDDNFFL
jgi:hypothetical protein